MFDYDERRVPGLSHVSRNCLSEVNDDNSSLQKHLESVVVGQPLPHPIMLAHSLSENVPIFALHPNGSFYVPMSIEMAMIRSHFQFPNEPTTSAPLLHPVSHPTNPFA